MKPNKSEKIIEINNCKDQCMFFGLFKSLDQKVKEDKENLISKLKSSDIRTLVVEMSNGNPISNNVVKKQVRDRAYYSGDSIRWIAYEISNELSDGSLKPKLIELLDEKFFFKHKKYVLRCLSSLCVNTKDYELFDFLISQLKQTEEEEIITSVLSRLKELRKPRALNIDYLKHLLLKGTYQNRIDALNAMQNSEHSELEDILIQEFKTSDQHTKGMICATLRTTGTRKSIEILKSEYKRTRSNDLRYFIESAIEEINIREKSNI